ncbi:MAG: Sugar fermentation stimulation protein [Candidatus Tokpelaia hoelldobleri]|uniref:Sugar fermentation stimulation protein homolog n=1 Tax=Candidatus Tokpelaia hoelldobleri TaxID=1902579 RepID=A0A1U9JV01_9HYPH|nr:MAG: Sugar fermentation stimulation protein [Candidatus Tokpelaia hoelldoblerii]
MFFTPSLIRASMLRRYKRFLADVVLEDGSEITVSVPNTGSMLGLVHEGGEVWLSHSDSPTRKYPHRLEIVHAQDTLVGVNTSLPNRIAEEAIRDNLIPALAPYMTVLREQRYGVNSRIDLLLRGLSLADAYVEVKNVHYMRHNGLAEFPDTVTARGAKHLVELGNVVKSGKRGIMLFVIQREDCHQMSICHDLDPEYGRQFALARKCGVEAYAIKCKISMNSIIATDMVPVNE